MAKNASDISENLMLDLYGEEVCMNLLKDHTTQQNIYWATDSYEALDAVNKSGSDTSDSDKKTRFDFFDPITKDIITSFVSTEGVVVSKTEYDKIIKANPESQSDYREIIRPRALKSREEQTQRSKDKAEVFTPAWICNAQNNLIDEAWFGRKDKLFNSPDPEDPHGWENNPDPISFEGTGKTWKDYVADMRLEITCGEAPYLCNRYDAVTGDYNEDVIHRIGMLDRKLRIVTENVETPLEWVLWGKIALRSTYGFEWQGDNLLLAREALLYTFAEHYIARWGQKKFNQVKKRIMPGASYIISYNIWQMNGLTYGLPGHEEEIKHRQAIVDEYKKKLAEYEKECKAQDKIKQGNLFSGEELNLKAPEKPVLPEPTLYEKFCEIKDFFYSEPKKGETNDRIDIYKKGLDNRKDFHDQSAPKQTFESIVNKEKSK